MHIIKNVPKKHLLSDTHIFTKEKLWALKEVKAKPAKRSVKAVKGGSLNDIHDLSDDDDDDEAQPQSVAVINKLKSNVIKRGGYQGFQGHYPDAINESVMQQLVKKH